MDVFPPGRNAVVRPFSCVCGDQRQRVTDRYLIWKFKRGSQDALRRIYEKYKHDPLKLAVSLAGDVHTAEDVVQDVFVAFIKAQLSASLLSGHGEATVRSDPPWADYSSAWPACGGYALTGTPQAGQNSIAKASRRPLTYRDDWEWLIRKGASI